MEEEVDEEIGELDEQDNYLLLPLRRLKDYGKEPEIDMEKQRAKQKKLKPSKKEYVPGMPQVEGLDGIFVGPTDLALTMGLTPGPEKSQPVLEEAIAHCVAMTKKAGKKAGIFCSGGKGSAIRRDEGFDLVVPTAELYILKKAIAQEIADYHEA